MEGQAVKLAPWGSLQCLQAQKQSLDLIMGQQNPLLASLCCCEHNGPACNLWRLIAPQINAMGQEVGFNGVDHGLVSFGLENHTIGRGARRLPLGLRCTDQPARPGCRSGVWPKPLGLWPGVSTPDSHGQQPIGSRPLGCLSGLARSQKCSAGLGPRCQPSSAGALQRKEPDQR